MSGNTTKLYLNRASDQLFRVFPPLCSPDYQTLRQFGFKNNSLDEYPRNLSSITQSGNKTYMLQEGVLWVGDFNTMMFSDRIELNKTIYAIEPIGTGIVVFTDAGIFNIPDLGRVEFVQMGDIASIKPIITCHGSGLVFALMDNNEVIACSIQFSANGTPFVIANKISSAIDNLVFSSNPQMVYCEDTLWIGSGEDIYGYSRGIWKCRYNFPNKIVKKLCKYREKLVAFFNENTTILYFDGFENIPSEE